MTRPNSRVSNPRNKRNSKEGSDGQSLNQGPQSQKDTQLGLMPPTRANTSQDDKTRTPHPQPIAVKDGSQKSHEAREAGQRPKPIGYVPPPPEWFEDYYIVEAELRRISHGLRPAFPAAQVPPEPTNLKDFCDFGQQSSLNLDAAMRDNDEEDVKETDPFTAFFESEREVKAGILAPSQHSPSASLKIEAAEDDKPVLVCDICQTAYSLTLDDHNSSCPIIDCNGRLKLMAKG